MQKFIFIFLLSFALFACSNESNTEKTTMSKASIEKPSPNKKQLRHVVLFKYKESATDADIKKVEAAFAGLPAKIPQIKDFEWGTNNSPEGLDKGFTHCFFLTFDSEEDRAIYLPHPDHKAFGDVLKPHLEDVLVLDYWTE
jgi:hypothetical protein